jgi:hypothetical protein
MIKIVNVIPQSLSGETNQDSEPNIAVNPANPRQVAITAFTPDPMAGPNAPIFVSTDGGDTWTLNSIVPSAGSIGTGDITPRFAVPLIASSHPFWTGRLAPSKYTEPTTLPIPPRWGNWRAARTRINPIPRPQL